MLKASVNSTARDFFDRYLEHDFRITRSLVTSPILSEIREVIKLYHKWEASRVKQLDVMSEGERFTPTHFDDSDVNLAVKLAVNDNLLNATKLRAKLATQFRPHEMPQVIQVNQHEIRLLFRKGVMAKKVGGTTKDRYSNSLNVILRDSYRQARADALDLLRYPHSRTGHSDKIKDLAPGTRAPNRSAAAKKRDGYLKGHGRAMMDQSGMVVSKGDEPQTTVAVMGLADGWDSIRRAEAVKKGKYSKDVMKMVSSVKKEIMDAIATEYQVFKFTNTPKGGGGINTSIKVDMHATDAKGNKALQHYDANGIRKFIEQKAEAVRDDLVKKMAHLEPQLSQSPTKEAQLVSQVNKRLITSLLGVAAANPDLRLKVNKRLLAEAKKIEKQKKRESAKGRGTNTSKTSKVIVAGSKIGRKVSTAKGAQRAARRSKNTTRTMDSPIALRNLINEALPQMVASKMTSPALQFRTGRFANSARVENVTMGPRGGIGIDYTYMRNPYETFEPGNKQGSTQRDPRKIIGASIRELAMSIIGRQPTTIRRQ